MPASASPDEERLRLLIEHPVDDRPRRHVLAPDQHGEPARLVDPGFGGEPLDERERDGAVPAAKVAQVEHDPIHLLRIERGLQGGERVRRIDVVAVGQVEDPALGSTRHQTGSVRRATASGLSPTRSPTIPSSCSHPSRSIAAGSTAMGSRRSLEGVVGLRGSATIPAPWRNWTEEEEALDPVEETARVVVWHEGSESLLDLGHRDAVDRDQARSDQRRIRGADGEDAVREGVQEDLVERRVGSPVEVRVRVEEPDERGKLHELLVRRGRRQGAAELREPGGPLGFRMDREWRRVDPPDRLVQLREIGGPRIAARGGVLRCRGMRRRGRGRDGTRRAGAGVEVPHAQSTIVAAPIIEASLARTCMPHLSLTSRRLRCSRHREWTSAVIETFNRRCGAVQWVEGRRRQRIGRRPSPRAARVTVGAGRRRSKRLRTRLRRSPADALGSAGGSGSASGRRSVARNSSSRRRSNSSSMYETTISSSRLRSPMRRATCGA